MPRFNQRRENVKVKSLIQKLQKMPEDADVEAFWLTIWLEIEHVSINSEKNKVVLSETPWTDKEED